ncbi:erythromycin esterase family protein [Umezawaea endophytica]|uniref:Erythromycin esterase family protein n=1 Tax=Umezawaea endophytica TaxID=1654476 RepID=A0A9X2VJI1_9PSEU|nr:erythromycin esterase family protein [Umezawaea endophytica]MCS7477716.1 erythromycin esterase family protein [Umezawaea endophytica]
MTSGTPAPLISATDHRALGDAVAARPRLPRVLGLGEPMHGEDEFLLVRNALFAALVDQAGFTTIALESSVWHGRVVDAYVRGGDGDEDDVLATGLTHEFGTFAGNRALVRWMREQNRHRPPGEHLRFAGFDAPVEMAAAPSPRAALQELHDFLRTHAHDELDLPPWEGIDRLLGPEDPWIDPAAAMDATRSIGADPRVHALRALTDDLRWALTGEIPRLRHEISADDLDNALLAGRTAAGLLAYHSVMARDTEHRWQHLSALRDALMADNVQAIADRGPTLVFGHNLHVRAGAARMAFGPATLRWQPAGALLADRLGDDYHVIACALGEAAHRDLADPPVNTVEGALHRDLPPGHHLLSAQALRPLQQRCVPRVSPSYNYFPIDETLLDQVDEILFLHTITADSTTSDRTSVW